ncbi:unnamed protein product, partial [Ixodes pacificus]
VSPGRPRAGARGHRRSRLWPGSDGTETGRARRLGAAVRHRCGKRRSLTEVGGKRRRPGRPFRSPRYHGKERGRGRMPAPAPVVSCPPRAFWTRRTEGAQLPPGRSRWPQRARPDRTCCEQRPPPGSAFVRGCHDGRGDGSHVDLQPGIPTTAATAPLSAFH